jgi:hypothetical protein
MVSYTRYLTVFSLLLITAIACNRAEDPSEILEADFITYKVNYLENMAGDIPTKMLPNEMEAYYSDRYIMTRIDGFFGQFSLVQVANLRQNAVTTMLNFFGNKVYYRGKKGEIPAGIVPLENPDYELTDDTREISGFESFRTVIKLQDQQYDIYYIKDIDIESPNITTPYYFIDYVLSDFRVQLSVLRMQLVMSGHESTTIQASRFFIPEDYREVSRETMESIINSLFTKE